VSRAAEGDEAWAARRKAEVASNVTAFVALHAADEAQRALLERALPSLRARRSEPPLTPSVHLPLLAFGALTGDDGPAVPLATATALLELGIDLLDHIADGELDAHWAGQPPALPHLAATGLLCALPQLALCALDVPAETARSLQRALARGLCAIGAGQQRDLAQAAAGTAAIEDIEAAVAGKTGERRALYARLAGLLSGAEAAQVEALAGMARHFGVALQWASDLADLTAEKGGRDLAAGTPTLPVALWLGTRDDPQAAGALLRAARRDAAARERLRATMATGGVVRGCLLKIEGERARARRLLAGLPAREPFRARLDRWLAEG
jgi:heptaprenyl diphosphate synthase